MPQLLWDASALAKRYFSEIGSDTVNALFAISPLSMLVTYLGFAETAAILRRKRNGGFLTQMEFLNAHVLLRTDVFRNPDFDLLTITDADILTGIDLSDHHNLNSTDAAILVAYLGYATSQPLGEPTCVLVASDLRLLRAAAAEGLQTLNPELLSAADVPAFLASLP